MQWVQHSVNRTKNFFSRIKFNLRPLRTRAHSSAGSRTRPANAGTRNPRGLTFPLAGLTLVRDCACAGRSLRMCVQQTILV